MSKNGVPQIIPFRFKKGQQSLNGMLGKRHTIETLFKMSISHGSGESNKRWVHDRTKLRTSEKHMNDTRYKYWSIEVKNRDGWTCRMSDHNCSGRIEAHHILGWRDYPELRYKIKNGITLCLSHHPRKRENEKELSTFFQNLVEGERK